MISPDRKHSSNSAIVSAISGSGYASRSGMPLPSLGSKARSSSFAYSSTRLDPRMSPTAPIHVPSSAPPTNETIDDCSDTLGDVAATGDLYR